MEIVDFEILEVILEVKNYMLYFFKQIIKNLFGSWTEPKNVVLKKRHFFFLSVEKILKILPKGENRLWFLKSDEMYKRGVTYDKLNNTWINTVEGQG